MLVGDVATGESELTCNTERTVARLGKIIGVGVAGVCNNAGTVHNGILHLERCLGLDLAESPFVSPGVFYGMKHGNEGHAERSNAGVSAPLRLSLLGRFSLIDGTGSPISVANGTQRLLSLLALRDRVVHRASIAGALWPDVSESHAHASLRSALLRIPNAARSVVSITDVELSLAEGVEVDVREAVARAHRLLDDSGEADENDANQDAIEQLSSDLLPGWRDDWVLPEAEEWRQLRLHALEALTDRFAAEARFGDATAAALAAIKAEPLRESAHAALIRVHLAESNQSEALRQFSRYQHLLRSELGIEPTSRLRELIGI